MSIPFLDLGAAYRELRSAIDEAVARELASGRYILGATVESFENRFAGYCGATHCVGVANGLDALHLALRGLGVGPGDEVIVPASTCIATWLAVSQAGATPVPVEPDAASMNIDPARIEAAITARTKAIVPVHLHGLPADLDPILAIAARHRLAVVEDAAQAHGTRYRGRRIGTHGDAVAWSFYPTKNLGAFGDAGAVTTRDAALAQRLRALRNYGATERDRHETRGFNSRLDPLQAAVLAVKLDVLDEWNARRERIAGRYHAELDRRALALPRDTAEFSSSWHHYVVRHPRRDALRESLARAGIETLVHYPRPPHMQPAYAAQFRPGAFPLATRIADTVVSLPIGPHLSDAQVSEVIGAVNASA